VFQFWVRIPLWAIAIIGLVAVTAHHRLVADEPGSSEYSDDDRSHWSLLPVERPAVPVPSAAVDRRWVRNDLDAFVLEGLAADGLHPAPEASRQMLIRRVYFDLTGLPPSPEEIRAFVDDSRADAYERLVDRLLDSPHYGERWAQHWLDVVRYAETEGFEYDNHRPGAWRFRDWVIEAFNHDMPYDEFVSAQLAGDELAPDDHAMQVAAGFHRLGPVRRNAGNAEVAISRNEILTEMTDVVGAAFLGLTVGCARCHDHMFDPIHQTDYYRLQAFLATTHQSDVPLASPEEQAAWEAAAADTKKELDRLKARKKELDEEGDASAVTELSERIAAVEERLPDPLPMISTVADDAGERTPIHLLKRGDWEQKLQPLGPRPLGVLLPEGTDELPADAANPKTALARWLTQPDHPLTARVMVNRIWQYHFGHGLVDTPNDFGLNGASPSHPELLDYLASTFVEGGWRIKPLHRMIVLSSAYRQSSWSPETELATERDPNNRLLWHYAQRRLEAEEVRDAMLAAAGRLNLKPGGPSVIVPVDPELTELLYKPSQWEVTQDASEHDRRSIYLIAKRNLRLPLLEVFDQPPRLTSCAHREASTHAPQALELLNGPTSNQLAVAFAERLEREAGDDPARQVERAYWLVAGRAPRESEREAAVAFLANEPLSEFALAMFNLNAFLYVD